MRLLAKEENCTNKEITYMQGGKERRQRNTKSVGVGSGKGLGKMWWAEVCFLPLNLSMKTPYLFPL